jgi:hypothetical protein
MDAAVRIVYLDQNKWIQLARAVKFPSEAPDLAALLKAVTKEVSAGRLVLPLTATNIYETHKINNAQKRHDLASIQAFLSGGHVFRARYKRLEVEVTEVLRGAYRLPLAHREENYFLSNVFFEAFAERDDERLGLHFSERAIEFIRSRPDFCLYEYLANIPEGVRITAVKKFSDGSDQLRQRIEERRSRHANESLPTRRRIHGAMLLLNEIDLVMKIAKKTEIPWQTVTDIGSSNARRIINEVPTYFVEREIALRLEAENRPIEENDFRDMQSFCAVVPYADAVIAENHFTNLAQ